jgi:hypothetical protein
MQAKSEARIVMNLFFAEEREKTVLDALFLIMYSDP